MSFDHFFTSSLAPLNIFGLLIKSRTIALRISFKVESSREKEKQEEYKIYVDNHICVYDNSSKYDY